jgi:hypothetical protein
VGSNFLELMRRVGSFGIAGRRHCFFRPSSAKTSASMAALSASTELLLLPTSSNATQERSARVSLRLRIELALLQAVHKGDTVAYAILDKNLAPLAMRMCTEAGYTCTTVDDEAGSCVLSMCFGTAASPLSIDGDSSDGENDRISPTTAASWRLPLAHDQYLSVKDSLASVLSDLLERQRYAPQATVSFRVEHTHMIQELCRENGYVLENATSDAHSKMTTAGVRFSGLKM